jgi:DNA polymerase-3 subunit delta
VLDELRTMPFLSDRRVVVVKGADDFVSENRELLERYFDNPCSSGVLILQVMSWHSQTRLAKKLSKVGKLIGVTQPKAWQLPQRLIGYAKGVHNKKLGTEAAELLIELAGDDLIRLYREIDKLALFADTQNTIAVKHVESLVGHNRIFGAFSVIESIISGDATCAIERLRNMFAEDKTSEYTVVGAFAFHLRRMFGAKALIEKGMHPAEIAKRFRIWSNKEKFFTQLRKISLYEIGVNLQRLAFIDYAIKTGRARAQVAIEQFVLSLADNKKKMVTSA